MAIDIETFENTPETELRELSNPEKVLGFLLANDGQAFEASEIATRANVNENSIHMVLGRLEERGLVRHKGSYWAIGDPDRIRSFGRYQRVTERLNERLGTEDKDAWRAHAAEQPGDETTDGE